MSDDAANPVVEPTEKEEISDSAEHTAPKPEIQAENEVVTEKEVNPLEPGGDRFKQVWARAKRAEEERDRERAERDREREERIRLSERLKTIEEQKQAQPEYTWDQLEEFITEGKVTRGQAQEYKDRMTEQRLERKFKQQQAIESKDSRILGEIEQYKQLLPDIMTHGSETRQKYEREFQYMVGALGMPDNYATQLAATRAAFGDVETVKTRNTSKKVITNKESFMETHAPSKQSSPGKSFKDTLAPWQIAHYEKLLTHRVYKDWKDIEEEQTWKPKSINQGRT